MFAQEVLVESLGVTLAKQFCDLLLQNRLHCLRHVLTVRHWKQTQLLVDLHAFVLCEESMSAFMYLLWRIAPNTGGARGDRGPMSRLSSPTAASKDTSLQTQTHIMSFKSQNRKRYESLCWGHQYGHLSWGRSQRPAGASLFYSLPSSLEESGTWSLLLEDSQSEEKNMTTWWKIVILYPLKSKWLCQHTHLCKFFWYELLFRSSNLLLVLFLFLLLVL